MLVTLLAAPRTAAAAGGRSRPQWDRSPPACRRRSRAGWLNFARARAPPSRVRTSKKVWGATLSEPRTPSPAPGAVEVIGVSGLARNGHTELDHAL